MHDHLREVVSAGRANGWKIIFVPHNRWEPGDYVSFDFPSPYQLGTARAEVFAKGSWGGTFHDDFQPQPGDVVAREHWGMDAAHAINGPTYAHAILTTKELLAQFSA